MNQQTISQNRLHPAKSLLAANENAISQHQNLYWINGLQFQNQDKSPPGG
jgi:hypothetical protein